ncbi:MAG: radical SAM family heme chaperone HemW [Dehalococcoidales bacterium]|nr:radical SAM family heme chaperone HemW [Dehalococcoidales bacterium]
MTRTIALYIHVPFCRRKCGYCSFVSCAGREADIGAYVDALGAELARRANGETVGSIFFGGGTPSLLSAGQLGDIFAAVRLHFNVHETAEISLEANPGTVDEGYLAEIRRLGINRLSLGVQSLDNAELELLGRIHTTEDAREAVTAARHAGFDNINLDLIYGLPGQTLAAWRRTLGAAIDLEPEHLSLYALTLEPDTPMYREIDTGRFPAIDPDLAADQYELAGDRLESAGYRHYEISNWVVPGRECRHNLVYWNNEPYLGFGVAAHSSVGGHRLANTDDLDAYLAAFSGNALSATETDEEISPDMCRAETVILGLRKGEGIDLAGLSERLGIDVPSEYRAQFEEMTEAGLLERSNGNIRLTRRGRLLSNEVFCRLLPEPDLT